MIRENGRGVPLHSQENKEISHPSTYVLNPSQAAERKSEGMRVVLDYVYEPVYMLATLA